MWVPPRATNNVAVPASETTRLRVFALRRPKPTGYTLINITSTSSSPIWRKLSPMLLGPIMVHTPRGTFTASCVENAWQYSKVYRTDLRGRPLVDELGEPNDAYYAWARRGWANPSPIRFPMGRNTRPLYSLGPQGDRLSYIEARHTLYAPWYVKTVTQTPAYKALKELYETGAFIGLVDFDGWDHVGQQYSLAAVLRQPTPKMGHAFVLAGLLTNDYFWKDRYQPVPLAPIDDDPIWDEFA